MYLLQLQVGSMWSYNGCGSNYHLNKICYRENVTFNVHVCFFIKIFGLTIKMTPL